MSPSPDVAGRRRTSSPPPSTPGEAGGRGWRKGKTKSLLPLIGAAGGSHLTATVGTNDPSFVVLWRPVSIIRQIIELDPPSSKRGGGGGRGEGRGRFHHIQSVPISPLRYAFQRGGRRRGGEEDSSSCVQGIHHGQPLPSPWPPPGHPLPPTVSSFRPFLTLAEIQICLRGR